MKGQKVNYTVVNVNKTKTIIKTPTKDDNGAVKKYLQEQKIQHHSFTSKEDRKCIILLKKIHFTHQPEDIINQLNSLGFKATNASPFRSRRDKSANFNAFVLEFERGTDLIAVSRIRNLLGEAVKWEKLQPNIITQCRNCQAFGHVSVNCQMKHRCVKCSEQHERGQCKRTDPNIGKPYCVLCKSEGHPANYEGCPYRKKIVAAKKEKEAERVAAKNTAATRSHLVPGKKFSDFLQPPVKPANLNKSTPKPQPQPKPQAKPSPVAHPEQPKITKSLSSGVKTTTSSFLNDSQKFFGCDFVTLLSKISDFLPLYEACPNEAGKKHMFLDFCFKICLGQ